MTDEHIMQERRRKVGKGASVLYRLIREAHRGYETEEGASVCKNSGAAVCGEQESETKIGKTEAKRERNETEKEEEIGLTDAAGSEIGDRERTKRKGIAEAVKGENLLKIAMAVRNAEAAKDAETDKAGKAMPGEKALSLGITATDKKVPAGTATVDEKNATEEGATEEGATEEGATEEGAKHGENAKAGVSVHSAAMTGMNRTSEATDRKQNTAVIRPEKSAGVTAASAKRQGKVVYHITLMFREGDYRTRARLNAVSACRKEAERIFHILYRNRVTPLSLFDIYEDMQTP